MSSVRCGTDKRKDFGDEYPCKQKKFTICDGQSIAKKNSGHDLASQDVHPPYPHGRRISWTRTGRA